jgi:hypothetical protein
MRLSVILASLALAVLGGCATSVNHQAGTGFPVTVDNTKGVTSGGCREQGQKDCLELRVLNIEWDPSHPMLAGLDRLPKNDVERQDRMQNLGPRSWKEVIDGTLKPAQSREFEVYLYGLKNADVAKLQAYRVNLDKTKEFGHTVTMVSFSRVVGGTYPQFDPAYNVGQPDLVIRIKASGPEAVAASLQVPKAMIGENTHWLLCAISGNTVYPMKMGKVKQGHWYVPVHFAWYSRRGTTRILDSFFSNDEGPLQVAMPSIDVAKGKEP